MLKVVNDIPMIVSANLLKTVEFRRKGQWFKVGPGMTITLDADTNIGLIDGYHVQLDEADFTILKPH